MNLDDAPPPGTYEPGQVQDRISEMFVGHRKVSEFIPGEHKPAPEDETRVTPSRSWEDAVGRVLVYGVLLVVCVGTVVAAAVTAAWWTRHLWR